jgi:hypothetical protein
LFRVSFEDWYSPELFVSNYMAWIFVEEDGTVGQFFADPFYAEIYTYNNGNGDYANVWVQDGGQAHIWATEKIYLNSISGIYQIISLPIYNNHAGADAHATLPQNALYKLTGDRAIYQKP